MGDGSNPLHTLMGGEIQAKPTTIVHPMPLLHHWATQPPNPNWFRVWGLGVSYLKEEASQVLDYCKLNWVRSLTRVCHHQVNLMHPFEDTPELALLLQGSFITLNYKPLVPPMAKACMLSKCERVGWVHTPLLVPTMSWHPTSTPCVVALACTSGLVAHQAWGAPPM